VGDRTTARRGLQAMASRPMLASSVSHSALVVPSVYSLRLQLLANRFSWAQGGRAAEQVMNLRRLLFRSPRRYEQLESN